MSDNLIEFQKVSNDIINEFYKKYLHEGPEEYKERNFVKSPIIDKISFKKNKILIVVKLSDIQCALVRNIKKEYVLDWINNKEKLGCDLIDHSYGYKGDE